MHCVREIRSACEMRCGALGDLFHFTLRRRSNISQCAIAHYFTFGNAEYFIKKTQQVADDIQGLRLDLLAKVWYNDKKGGLI